MFLRTLTARVRKTWVSFGKHLLKRKAPIAQKTKTYIPRQISGK